MHYLSGSIGKSSFSQETLESIATETRATEI